MLEIDGELFEDPCETIKAERVFAVFTLISTGIQMLSSQVFMIMSQPLFPPRIVGGIIPDQILKGDIICQPKSDFKMETKRSLDPMDIRILNMYEEIEK